MGKGIDFTRRRLEEHLHRYYRQYGDNEGYVILIDFKNYFGSIDHQELIESYKKVIPEDDIIHLISYLINLNEGEFGLGIGAQLSQNAGIFFPSPLDQYFKVVKQQKYYGAYMDDRYIIAHTKEEAVELLYEFKKYAKSLNLVINEKKTHIIKLSYGFTFLKFRYVLTDTGKVVTYQKNNTFVRERRRLKKFKKNGMSEERACECYRAWRGTVKRQKNNYYRICRMDKLFSELYPGVDFRTKKEVKEGKIIKFIDQERKVA